MSVENTFQGEEQSPFQENIEESDGDGADEQQTDAEGADHTAADFALY